MLLTIFIILFFVSLIAAIAVLYWQWKRVQKGEIEITGLSNASHDQESPITIRDIGILILYIVKHALQFIIVQLSRLYFLISHKIKNLPKHKNPKIAKIVSKLKIPPVPEHAKVFVKRTYEETKQKINRVRQDLAHLEESIDKRVD
jgi:hypothetical protein